MDDKGSNFICFNLELKLRVFIFLIFGVAVKVGNSEPKTEWSSLGLPLEKVHYSD